VARDGASRRKAERAGRRGEQLAAWYLRLKGYRILGRNMRTPLGEIDLVIRRGSTLVFVEVKRRRGTIDPRAVVGARQRDRVSRAAGYLLSNGRLGADAQSFRFDVIVLTSGKWPIHLQDAWRP